MRSTASASRSGTWSRKRALPYVVRDPGGVDQILPPDRARRAARGRPGRRPRRAPRRPRPPRAAPAPRSPARRRRACRPTTRSSAARATSVGRHLLARTAREISSRGRRGARSRTRRRAGRRGSGRPRAAAAGPRPCRRSASQEWPELERMPAVPAANDHTVDPIEDEVPVGGHGVEAGLRVQRARVKARERGANVGGEPLLERRVDRLDLTITFWRSIDMFPEQSLCRLHIVSYDRIQNLAVRESDESGAAGPHMTFRRMESVSAASCPGRP